MNGTNYLDCVTARNVNMIKNKVNTSQEGRLHRLKDFID